MVSVDSTSIKIAWDSIPCVDRNSNISEYQIITHSFYSLHSYYVDVNQHEFKAINLIPGTNYWFIVIVISEHIYQARSLSITTELSKGISLDCYSILIIS